VFSNRRLRPVEDQQRSTFSASAGGERELASKPYKQRFAIPATHAFGLKYPRSSKVDPATDGEEHRNQDNHERLRNPARRPRWLRSKRQREVNNQREKADADCLKYQAFEE
jgi:hypothetical protein